MVDMILFLNIVFEPHFLYLINFYHFLHISIYPNAIYKGTAPFVSSYIILLQSTTVHPNFYFLFN